MYSESMSDNALPLYNLGGTSENQNHHLSGKEENDQFYKSPLNFGKGLGSGAVGGFNDFSRYCFTEAKVPFKNTTNDTNLPQQNYIAGNQQINSFQQCPFATDKKMTTYQQALLLASANKIPMSLGKMSHLDENNFGLGLASIPLSTKDIDTV